MIVFAHAGHVLLDLLYAAPLLVMVALLVVGKMREKRARDEVTSAPGGVSRPHDDAGTGA